MSNGVEKSLIAAPEEEAYIFLEGGSKGYGESGARFNRFSIVRFSTLGLVIAVIATTFVTAIYLCLACECVSKNLVDNCHDGFCIYFEAEVFGNAHVDFVGLEKEMSSLRASSVETIIIPISTFNETNDGFNMRSFKSMVKKGRRIGVSTLISIYRPYNETQLRIVEEVKKLVAGFITDESIKEFEEIDQAFWKTVNGSKCYKRVDDISKLSAPVPSRFVGTWFSNKNAKFHSDKTSLAHIANNVFSTKESPRVLSVFGDSYSKENEMKDTLLQRLIFLGFTNSSIGMIFKGTPEALKIGVNGGNATDNDDGFKEKLIQTLNSIKNLRRFKPHIGENLTVEEIESVPSGMIGFLKFSKEGKKAIIFLWNKFNEEVPINVHEVVNSHPLVKGAKLKVKTVYLHAESSLSATDFKSDSETLIKSGNAVLMEAKLVE